MSDQNALKVLDGGLLEHSKVGRVDNSTWADQIGRILTDSGETTEVMGWGHMDGTVKILVDEQGDKAYYIK